MAKNKNNNFKGKASNSNKNSNTSSSKNSVKDSHSQVPDNSPNRSGPGGE